MLLKRTSIGFAAFGEIMITAVNCYGGNHVQVSFMKANGEGMEGKTGSSRRGQRNLASAAP